MEGKALLPPAHIIPQLTHASTPGEMAGVKSRTALSIPQIGTSCQQLDTRHANANTPAAWHLAH
eukprot:1157222-Pelagomonas_calceolata.AAC.14